MNIYLRHSLVRVPEYSFNIKPNESHMLHLHCVCAFEKCKRFEKRVSSKVQTLHWASAFHCCYYAFLHRPFAYEGMIVRAHHRVYVYRKCALHWKKFIAHCFFFVYAIRKTVHMPAVFDFTHMWKIYKFPIYLLITII